MSSYKSNKFCPYFDKVYLNSPLMKDFVLFAARFVAFVAVLLTPFGIYPIFLPCKIIIIIIQ